ncbi:MAG: hypothetical protein QHC67_04850 [Sphingobium sp.]|uniref:hypothetical protein n=1 Tax=Sphingobium sp. TaxID=1912891 RepID=UPI0029B81B60|nr:hypothetical protein [Sphingobium sp.]MDX3909130.1 hypothetical protein [Sphingobium sp.]
MNLSWDTSVRFFRGNGEPGFRCTFKGCLALFAGMSPDERFLAFAEFDQPVSMGGKNQLIEMGARELEAAAELLKYRPH